MVKKKVITEVEWELGKMKVKVKKHPFANASASKGYDFNEYWLHSGYSPSPASVIVFRSEQEVALAIELLKSALEGNKPE